MELTKKLNILFLIVSLFLSKNILAYKENISGENNHSKRDISHVETKKLEPNFKKLKEIGEELFPDGEPGAAVLIMKDEKIIFEEYYGLANLPNGPKIDKDIRFNIASVSKQFTAVSILQLIAKGNISLEESMDLYFPEYTDPIWKKIKVKHLLSHSSGIPDDRDYLTREQKIYGNESIALEYMQWLNYTHFEPGTNYEYMNPTYVLLGRLIERKSDQNFTNYVNDHIFKPANMTQTAYIFQEQNPAHAYEYDRDSGEGEESGGDRPEGPHNWYEFDYGEETFFGTRPDGGIYTTPRDFVKWELALPKLLPENLLQEAFKPQTYVYGSNWSDYQNRPDTWYGYGWFIEPEKQCIYHTGDNGGFKILASRYPKNKTLVLVFAARADWDRYGFKTKIEEILHFVSKIKNKVIFIRQIQMIDKKLKIFAIVNYNISKTEKFRFSLVINSVKTNNILQEKQVKSMEFRLSDDYDGNFEKIIELTSCEEFEENTVVSLKKILDNYDNEIKFNDNKNNLDTENVTKEIEKGEIDYHNLPTNYKVYHYSVNYATNGCEFSLNLLEDNKEFNKALNLSFIEVDNDNIINAKCQLSKENRNSITCQLNDNINNNYILEPYIFSDNSKTIIISQNDTNNYLTLTCSSSSPDKSNSSILSTSEIIGIIAGLVGAIAIVIIIIFIIKKCKNNNTEEINDNSLTNDLKNDD